MSTVLKIGTRGSTLALTQANMVRDALLAAHDNLSVEIVEILTSGDWKPEDGETRLRSEDGGKGQFAKEIEEQLLNGSIDLAVHSMKDMETKLPDGLVIEHMLPREDPRDAVLVHPSTYFDGKIANLDTGTVIGTSSVRRQAFLLAHNHGIKVNPLRGNVETRIHKLNNAQVQVTLLAYAGLKRLGLESHVHTILSTDEFLPAAGQGAVGIEVKSSRDDVRKWLDPISCRETYLCVSAERAALDVLDGSCHTPIGAHATLKGESLFLRLRIAALDGKQVYNDECVENVSSIEDAIHVGRALGQKLKDTIPPELTAQKIKDE